MTLVDACSHLNYGTLILKYLFTKSISPQLEHQVRVGPKKPKKDKTTLKNMQKTQKTPEQNIKKCKKFQNKSENNRK